MFRLAVALLCAIALVVVPVSAAAAAPLGVLGVSGSTGPGDGQFQQVGGVAVNDSTGDVYVIDMGGQRVERFDAAGAFQGSFGAAGTGNGQFAFETVGFNTVPSLAVDQSDGSVYVADPGNDRVQKFSSAGTYLTKFGTTGSGDGEFSKPVAVAVDPTDGAVYVADNRNYRVQKFSSAGAYLSQFGGAGEGDGQLGSDRGPSRIGVDSSGRIYVLDQDGSRRVQRFTAGGAFDQVLTSGDTLGAVPFSLAVDTTGDHVFVGGLEGTITEFDGSGATVEVHLSGGIVQQMSGIGLRAGALTFTAGYDGFDSSSDVRLFRVGAVTAATLSIQATTGIGGTTATLNATINPNGAPGVTYHFETSDDFGTTWKRAPANDVSVGDGMTDVPVSQEVTGLKPYTFYFFQLIVTKAYNGTVTSEPYVDFFQTLTIAPTVTDTASVPTERGARIKAKINPNGVETTYQLEYGPTTAYGKTFPAIATSAGAGYDPIAVARVISGLSPGTEYHYRVTATNEAGTTHTPDATFTTSIPQPPSGEDSTTGRAYELVSPADKAGGAVDAAGKTVQIAPNGDAIAFSASSAFPGAQASNLLGYYVSRRSSAGWATDGIDPPQLFNGDTAFQALPTKFLTRDLTQAVQFSNRGLASGAVDGAANFYRHDLVSDSLTAILSGGPTLTSDFGSSASAVAIASGDGSHVILNTHEQLLPDAYSQAANAYELVGGSVRLINRLPDGTATAGGAVGSPRGVPSDHSISDDGRRVYFADATGGGNSLPLYLRTDGAVTTPVSVSHRPGDSDAVEAAIFAGASADGRYAFFSSVHPLTPEADPSLGKEKLYRYDANDGSLTSTESPSGEPSGEARVIRVARDGSRVYWVAAAPVPSLYVWDGVTQRKVADLANAGAQAGLDESSPNVLPASLSSNGRFFLFSSRGDVLDATDLNPSCAVRSEQDQHIISTRCWETYLYDAHQDELECLSCDDATPNGNSKAIDNDRTILSGEPQQVLDDGRAFFSSDESLIPTDVNGRKDVYAWDDGKLSLITSGTEDANALLRGVSADGRDVFFTTTAGLVAQDIDGSTDLYDARLGGGIASQNIAAVEPQPCDGELCQGQPATRSVPETAGSVTFSGPGNQPGARSVGGSVSVAKRKSVTGTVATLKVKVPSAGSLTMSGPAVVTGKRTAGKAGSYSLRIGLTAKSKVTLRKKASLTATVRVVFVPKAGKATTATVRVTFRQFRSKLSKRVSTGDALSKGRR
jgi:sugar lactone lactonase YvrE